MKKIIALFLSAVLLLSVAAMSAAAEDGIADQIEDKLHASIQREENSPEWITALPYAQDESIRAGREHHPALCRGGLWDG